MHLRKFLWLAILLSQQILLGQSSSEIWGIGTKWTYEYEPFANVITYLSQEITDTSTINGLKLYLVESTPSNASPGIQYFYYKDGDVYNYDIETQILQLLYDFDNTTSYPVDYRPICDPYFSYDSLVSRKYYAQVNDVKEYLMPDDSYRTLQSISITDTIMEEGGLPTFITVRRQVLDRIGFLSGNLHHTHDWELGTYICDEWGNFVNQLRCFENYSIAYNFNDFPCDSSWVITSTNEIDKDHLLSVYPNPAQGEAWIKNFVHPISYNIMDTNGEVISQGKSTDGRIALNHNGLNLIQLKTDDQNWKVFKIYNQSHR